MYQHKINIPRKPSKQKAGMYFTEIEKQIINETPRRASALKFLSVSDKQRGIFIGISSSSSQATGEYDLRS